MLLKEMFSPIGAPNDAEQEIDWLDDLKYFIDNDTDMLSRYFFPAIKKHQEYKGHPKVFQIYIRPLQNCLDRYCEKFDIDGREEKFPKEKIIDLAKRIANEQEQFIEKGDYE